ncbi:MAG: hypothetical protein GQ529_10010 [Methyloprofundus sp.]|nr:hypothetical protein [Methyloprofundus sp.]
MTLYIHLFLIGFFVLWSPFLKADWMNLTGAETAQNIAEIYVLDDHVEVKLEVYVDDLDKFEELIPDEWFNKTSVSERPPLEQRMQTFATQRLQFITEKGVRLAAKLKLLEPRTRVDRLSPFAGMINPMTRQRVKGAPADKRVLYAEIDYPFPRTETDQAKTKTLKPEQLTIIPPLGDKGVAIANIGFIAYHQAVPITDFRYLGQAETLNLDWQDPWYTKFDNKNLIRHHKYPLMLYLYVEPRQVRLESLLRISDIAKLTGFNVVGSYASVAEKHKLLQEHIKNYYADKAILQIDGTSFKPDSIRVEFLHATLTGLKSVENSSSADELSLLAGVSQQYFIQALPQKIESRWQYFNQRINRIPVIVTDPVGPLQNLIDKDDPVFGWQNFLKKYKEPIIQPVRVKTGLSIDIPYLGEKKILNKIPDQKQALSIVDAVLENVRIAFIEKEADHFSRVLGEIVSQKDSKFLAKELAKLFAPKVSGGAVGSVQDFNDVHIINVRKLDHPNGFSTTINGSANISAKHWGHIDQRLIKFQLLLDLIEENKQWRLAELTVIDIKEVK